VAFSQVVFLWLASAFGNEWYWHNSECGDTKVHSFQVKNYGPNVTYPDIARLFRAELYDADNWVSIFKDAGAQYVLPVGKHHDGFCMCTISQSLQTLP